MKKLETYLQALQAGAYREEIIIGTIDALKFCAPQELSENRLLVAAVYCHLLQYCQTMYKGNIPEDIIEELLNLFENIEQIGREASEEEKKDSNLTIVWFLHELKVHRESLDVWNIEDERLRDSVPILLQELDDLYFVFDIKKDGRYVFPIHNMIAKVVGTTEFIDSNNSLDVYHIHILQLAVRLFTNEDDKQRILRTLETDCNLRFISYLGSEGYIIDTLDLLNYQKNGVMIFYDKVKNKVLIRHKNRNYFEGQPRREIEGLTIENELDYRKNKIGFFVEYNLDKSELLTDYSNILSDVTGRESFLRMVFSGKVYNVLLEYSIVQEADGSLIPINPFCYNDEIIVKGWTGEKNGRIYDKEHFSDALRRYRNAALKVNEKCVMNRVSFGLALMLLQKENTGIDPLGLNDFVDTDWYQSQLLKNWIQYCYDPIDALTYITSQWQKENDYCALPYKKNKKSREKDIESHEIEALDFYPVKSQNGWIYQALGCEKPEEWYVLRGKAQENSDGSYILAADLVSDVVGKRFSQETGKQQFFIEKEKLEDIDEVFADFWGGGEEYYFLYNAKEQQGIIREQALLKTLSELERIQAKNHFTLETASEISRTQYNEIKNMMRLQKDAFDEAGKRFFCDFESQVYYRLLHNLLWSEIDKDKVENYLKIFMYHQKLKFSEITQDEKFMRGAPNTLYVPKDERESDSVLNSIYETYLKSKMTRETNDLYKHMLELKDDGYYFGDNRIENVLFLCDNFECGTATIRMLKAYLDIDIDNESEEEQGRIEQVRASRQKYYLRDVNLPDGKASMTDVSEQLQEVLLKDVVQRNNCSIEIHGYYGTQKGKETIESFLEIQHIESAQVTYEKEIVKHAGQIIEDVKTIWPRFSPRGDLYAVVREFNMPKRNIFPNTMLDDPGKSICMFVKKPEIRKRPCLSF